MISLFRFIYLAYPYWVHCAPVLFLSQLMLSPPFTCLAKLLLIENQTLFQLLLIEDGTISHMVFPFYLRQVEIPYYLQENRIVYRPTTGRDQI